MKLCLGIVLSLMLVSNVAAQSASDSSQPTLQTAVPYTDEEFEPWALKLRRAEIIAIGAFPLTYLLSGIGYDYAYYLSSGYPSNNIPWPVGPGTSRWTTATESEAVQKKNLTLVGISLAAGILIAGIDWWLGE